MNKFKVISDFIPQGDQPDAIQNLKKGILNNFDYQTLMGITGSGKSATIAWLIEELQMPALVLAPNKALAAQLANEFKQFFPENRVEYFVSYYDYYQPEAYVPRTDTFIEKDSNINEIILATNFTVEGNATAQYIKELFKDIDIKTTRIARGLPIGGEIEYVDSGTLAQAIVERKKI